METGSQCQPHQRSLQSLRVAGRDGFQHLSPVSCRRLHPELLPLCRVLEMEPGCDMGRHPPLHFPVPTAVYTLQLTSPWTERATESQLCDPGITKGRMVTKAPMPV